ncbi:hypothetical protein MK851_11770 [Tenacibaculum sp. 1B UA]|uniref:hypothetical protein n=1 Tax=Tenacibaculum sp. 1B UA TaxID=2922252 RepID=UPI002A2425C0|nr:hypothetical protein [Tenacibaculum sp. 1B UA]MDX8554298.1 hypothetical protein [Tenacibaculum sp. 1B UA]
MKKTIKGKVSLTLLKAEKKDLSIKNKHQNQLIEIKKFNYFANNQKVTKPISKMISLDGIE